MGKLYYKIYMYVLKKDNQNNLVYQNQNSAPNSMLNYQ